MVIVYRIRFTCPANREAKKWMAMTKKKDIYGMSVVVIFMVFLL